MIKTSLAYYSLKLLFRIANRGSYSRKPISCLLSLLIHYNWVGFQLISLKKLSSTEGWEENSVKSVSNILHVTVQLLHCGQILFLGTEFIACILVVSGRSAVIHYTFLEKLTDPTHAHLRLPISEVHEIYSIGVHVPLETLVLVVVKSQDVGS